MPQRGPLVLATKSVEWPATTSLRKTSVCIMAMLSLSTLSAMKSRMKELVTPVRPNTVDRTSMLRTSHLVGLSRSNTLS